MSEKLSPQNNNEQNDHEKNGRAENVSKVIAKHQKKLESVTSSEERAALEKRIEDLKGNLDYDNDPESYGNRNPVVYTESVDSASSETTGDVEPTSDTEMAPLTPAERKYELMKSDSAQLAFLEGGNEAYVAFLEQGFQEINDSYSKELVIPSREETEDNVPTDEKINAETDANGKPVEHQFEWSRQGASTDPSKELVHVPKSKELVPIKKAELVPVKNFEVPAELQEALDAASEEYARLTARDRKSYLVGRYTKEPKSITGKILRAIPGVRKMTGAVIDKMNGSQEAEINDARIAYEEAVAKIQEAFGQYGAEQNIDAKDLEIYKAMVAGGEDLKLEGRIIDQRHNQSKDAGKFVDWWVSQEGKMGMLKKAGVVIGAGAVAGGVAALAAPLWVSAAAGGAVGGFIANRITKRRANAHVYSRDSEGKINRDADGKKIKLEQTIAETQAEEDAMKKAEAVNAYGTALKAGERDDSFAASELTDLTENRSDEEAFNNRSRMRKAVALGAAAGKLGGFASEALQNIDFGGGDAPKPKPADAPPTPEAPPAPEAPSLNGESFTVEAGSGYTKELMQFAQANGHNLSPSQAFQLHEHLMSKFGADYINIKAPGGDIYNQAGDIRLSSPGNAEWVKGVTAASQQWMAGKGLW